MDKLNHASLKVGTKLVKAKVINFKHNDFKDAERLILKNKVGKFNKIIMVIEGIYSMDGDIGDIVEARRLCDKYNVLLICDEAHSLGTIGKTGHGVEEHYDYKASADVICGTFTKSISSVGGYITCSKELREYLTFYAPGVVFSAPLSAYHAGAAIRAFEIIEENPNLIKKLHENSDYARKQFKDNGFNIGVSTTCVVPVIFPDNSQVVEMHAYMKSKGYFTSAVMAPACPVDQPRFRICITSSDNKESVDNIIELFKDIKNRFPVNERIQELITLLK